ncbi:MAG: ATP-dependent DNA ligase [Deltaproteobacteria bacterium]|nr:MAG: ATP-dependent DNA ligase [Deltaproteobacteria bacterium]
MRHYLLSALCFVWFVLMSSPVCAHFGMVIPSHDVVEHKQDAKVHLQLSFAHPMEATGMHLVKPKAFYVVKDGKQTNLKSYLTAAPLFNHKAWGVDYTISRPGLYQFVMEPVPYWEPVEDCFIIHYTKTYVSAFGEEEGWETPLGLKTEIVPLTRPFANYAGNLFQGQVLVDGKPVPNTTVEVEYYNKNKTYRAPNETFITQVVTTDANGVFSYAVPFAGWWGFAALNTASEKMDFQGTPKDVELGAVLWTQFLAPVHN